jgi:hypothetical protein
MIHVYRSYTVILMNFVDSFLVCPLILQIYSNEKIDNYHNLVLEEQSELIFKVVKLIAEKY